MRYYLYRITDSENPIYTSAPKEIAVEYMSKEGVNASDGDGFVVYVAGNLRILGYYLLKENVLYLKSKPSEKLTIKDFFSVFSFISEVTDRTVRMFKKKTREITQDDANAVLSRMN